MKSSISTIGDVCTINLPSFVDDRGGLTVVSEMIDIPIAISRVFFTYSTREDVTRGSHAHKVCSQLLLCPYGSFEVEVTDGLTTKTYELNSPSVGLFLPSLIWSTQKSYSPGAVCLVLASEKYDPDEYLRNFDEFLDFRNGL